MQMACTCVGHKVTNVILGCNEVFNVPLWLVLVHVFTVSVGLNSKCLKLFICKPDICRISVPILFNQ